MMQRIFVRVVGFSSVERHALNTVFRLSQDHRSIRTWSYEPWQEELSTAAPRLALIDGASPDANEALAELEMLKDVGIVWVGSISPAKAWRAFVRPLSWTAVLASFDEYFMPRGEQRVEDVGHSTWPSVLELEGEQPLFESSVRRALVADADIDSRLYLRTKLLSYGISSIDEAENVLEAKDLLSIERLQRSAYELVIIDLDLPGGDPWTVSAMANHPCTKLLTQHRLSLASRLHAKINGCFAMSKPLNPSRLNALLNKIA